MLSTRDPLQSEGHTKIESRGMEKKAFHADRNDMKVEEAILRQKSLPKSHQKTKQNLGVSLTKMMKETYMLRTVNIDKEK